MCMVHLISYGNKSFARLAADNLINYVVIDFENHLIPVVSSLLSPMRNFDHFKELDLKITIEVLSSIMKRLIEYLEWMEKLDYYHPEAHKYMDATTGHHHLVNEHSVDSEYDDMMSPPHVHAQRARGMTDYEVPPDHNHVDAADIDTAFDNVEVVDHHYGGDEEEEEAVGGGVGHGLDPRKIAMNLGAGDREQSDEYDDVNQEFYRVKNALSLDEVWPHIRLLVEGYIVLWYVHPEEYIRKELEELLKVVRHPTIINYIDPSNDEFPSIYDAIQQFKSRHHNNSSINMGTNTSIPASAVSIQSQYTAHTVESSNTNGTHNSNLTESSKDSKYSKYSKNGTKSKEEKEEEQNKEQEQNPRRRRYIDSSLPQRFAFDDEQYRVSHQFPLELESLILNKGKVFEGLLSWVFLRARPQLKQFFDEIAEYVKDGMSMDAYHDDNFVVMKHRWELMCLSVRIDDNYYQQISNESMHGNNEYNIKSFHRARSSSSVPMKWTKYSSYAPSPNLMYGNSTMMMNMNMTTSMQYGNQSNIQYHQMQYGRSTPHKRYQSGTSATMYFSKPLMGGNGNGNGFNGNGNHSSHPSHSVLAMGQVVGSGKVLPMRGREGSQSKTVVIKENVTGLLIKNRVQHSSKEEVAIDRNSMNHLDSKHDRNGTTNSTSLRLNTIHDVDVDVDVGEERISGLSTNHHHDQHTDLLLAIKNKEQRRHTADSVTLKKEERNHRGNGHGHGQHGQHHGGGRGMAMQRRQKSSSAADVQRKGLDVGVDHHHHDGDQDLDVVDLMSSIKFSRSRSQGVGGRHDKPTAMQLQSGRNRLRLVKRSSARPHGDTKNRTPHDGVHASKRLKRRVRKKSKTQMMEYTKMEEHTSAENLSSNEEEDKKQRRDSRRDPKRDPNALSSIQSVIGSASAPFRKRVPSQSKDSVKDGAFLKMNAESPTSPMPRTLQQGIEESADIDGAMSLEVIHGKALNETGTFVEVAMIQSDDELDVDGMGRVETMASNDDEEEEEEENGVTRPDPVDLMNSIIDDHADDDPLKLKTKEVKPNEEEKIDSGWNEGSDEDGDQVGALLSDNIMNSTTIQMLEQDINGNVSSLDNERKENINGIHSTNSRRQTGTRTHINFSESVQFGAYTHNQYNGGYRMENENESDSEQIDFYHREQISTFLAPMRDIRIPKRRLEDFVDKIVDFTLSLEKIEDDAILDSIFEPIQRMDVSVSEILIKHLFRRAFERESDRVGRRPIDENDTHYKQWTAQMMKTFYFHAPTLHLMTMVFTNKGIMRKEIHTTSNEFAIGLDKVIIATIYLVEDTHLQSRSFEVVLYLLILMKQFFYFYRNAEAKFTYHPFLDIPSKESSDQTHGGSRVILRKKPRPLSNMRMRANLLDFIQTHMSTIPKRIRKEMQKYEGKSSRRHGLGFHRMNATRYRAMSGTGHLRQYQKLVHLHDSIENALAECILGLIELGPIGEKSLEMALLKELEKYICHQENGKLKSIAQKGMNAVFKHNSHLLEFFIQQSCKLHLYYNEFVVGTQDTIQTRERASSRNGNGDDGTENVNHLRHNRNDKNITQISLAYLTSLVSNFQSNILGLNPISALVLCMLHQCSPHQQARSLALKLAKCMAEPMEMNKSSKGHSSSHYHGDRRRMKHCFNPGNNFVFETTESSPDEYLRSAFDYSERIAKLSPKILPQVLYEVVRFYDRVESEYDRNILLRLLPPWISQFGTVANKMSDYRSCREMTYAFIVKLYELTQKAGKSPHQRSKQLTLSYVLWGKLALSTPDKTHFDGRQPAYSKTGKKYNEMLITEIVKYLISKYTVQGPQDEHQICEKILERICKECQASTAIIETTEDLQEHKLRRHIADTNTKLVANRLAMSLHRYPDEFPLDPEAFREYKQEQMRRSRGKGRKGRGHKDVIKSKEQAAFKLILKLLDSKVIKPFRKYIPLLLQNAAIIKQNSFDDILLRLAKYFEIAKESKSEQSEVSWDRERDGDRDRDGNDRSHALHRYNDLNPNYPMNVIESDINDDPDPPHKMAMNMNNGGGVGGHGVGGGKRNKKKSLRGISVWLKYHRKMCHRWSKVAISWALQANKSHITMYSVEVFDALHCYRLNDDLLVQLSLITYHCIQKSDYPTALFTMILQILDSTLCDARNHDQWNETRSKTALCLAYVLLSLQHVSIHKSALKFWNKYLSRFEELPHRMEMILSYGDPAHIDQVIAHQLQHSLAREELFEPSLSMLEKLCCLYSTKIKAKDNKLLHLTILAHMLRIQIVYQDQIRNANCKRLNRVLQHYEQETRGMDQMIRTCSTVDRYANFHEFLTDCYGKYCTLFPSPAVFTGGLIALCNFIEYGSKLWYVSVLTLIDIVLDVTAGKDKLLIDAFQFKRISNVLILSSYLSPLRVPKKPNTDLLKSAQSALKLKSTKTPTKPSPAGITNVDAIGIGRINGGNTSSGSSSSSRSGATRTSVLPLSPSAQSAQWEFINLTPLVSRIALKLTQRKQLRLPQDNGYLFQFMDPLPDVLSRSFSPHHLLTEQSPSIRLNKRLVLTEGEEKKCERDTIQRMKDYLLPLLTEAVSNMPSDKKHVRTASVLEPRVDLDTKSLVDRSDRNKRSRRRETEREQRRSGGSGSKIEKDRDSKHVAMSSNASYLSTHSVVTHPTPTVSGGGNETVAYHYDSDTPRPNELTPPATSMDFDHDDDDDLKHEYDGDDNTDDSSMESDDVGNTRIGMGMDRGSRDIEEEEEEEEEDFVLGPMRSIERSTTTVVKVNDEEHNMKIKVEQIEPKTSRRNKGVTYSDHEEDEEEASTSYIEQRLQM